MSKQRVNISLEESALNTLDFLAKQSQMNRSQLIQRLAYNEYKRRREEFSKSKEPFPKYSEVINGEAAKNANFYEYTV